MCERRILMVSTKREGDLIVCYCTKHGWSRANSDMSKVDMLFEKHRREAGEGAWS